MLCCKGCRYTVAFGGHSCLYVWTLGPSRSYRACVGAIDFGSVEVYMGGRGGGLYGTLARPMGLRSGLLDGFACHEAQVGESKGKA